MKSNSFSKEVFHMLNTAIVTNQPTFPMNCFAERKPYKTDPFTLIDGRYVGHDGFVVPKDFDEFHQRFPHHIPNWVKRHADRLALKEDLEDWTQDLIIHLKYLAGTGRGYLGQFRSRARRG
ncbi:MAG: hypothetical protein WB711_03380 [Terriglobales bacterium]